MAAVVPSLDGPVLEVLSRTTQPLTGREVHRLAATGSESGVRLVLNRMVDHGLVTATRAGQARLYGANRAHIAWPPVEALIGLRREFFRRMGDLISSWTIQPVTAAVFGSTARRDGSTASDIDILLVRHSGDDDVWEFQVDDLHEQVTAWTGNHCQVYEITDTEFGAHLDAGEAIVDEWRRDAIVISGVSVDQLSQMGAA